VEEEAVRDGECEQVDGEEGGRRVASRSWRRKSFCMLQGGERSEDEWYFTGWKKTIPSVIRSKEGSRVKNT